MIKILIPLGISLIALFFVLYLIFSKRQKTWDEMSDKEKKRKKIMIFSGIVVFIAGIIAALSLGKKDKT
jgi:uncharacterized membrane protein HdeD (DUF308 family)